MHETTEKHVTHSYTTRGTTRLRELCVRLRRFGVTISHLSNAYFRPFQIASRDGQSGHATKRGEPPTPAQHPASSHLTVRRRVSNAQRCPAIPIPFRIPAASRLRYIIFPEELNTQSRGVSEFRFPTFFSSDFRKTRRNCNN